MCKVIHNQDVSQSTNEDRNDEVCLCQLFDLQNENSTERYFGVAKSTNYMY